MRKVCLACGKPLIRKPKEEAKEFRDRKTCGYSCANKYYRSGPKNGNWKDESYRTTCFHYHPKKCIICGEKNIVAVHHLDENRSNNKPENLIPLCPTHHQYWHSGFRYLIEEEVYKYIETFKLSIA